MPAQRCTEMAKAGLARRLALSILIHALGGCSKHPYNALGGQTLLQACTRGRGSPTDSAPSPTSSLTWQKDAGDAGIGPGKCTCAFGLLPPPISCPASCSSPSSMAAVEQPPPPRLNPAASSFISSRSGSEAASSPLACSSPEPETSSGASSGQASTGAAHAPIAPHANGGREQLRIYGASRAVRGGASPSGSGLDRAGARRPRRSAPPPPPAALPASRCPVLPRPSMPSNAGQLTRSRHGGPRRRQRRAWPCCRRRRRRRGGSSSAAHCRRHPRAAAARPCPAQQQQQPAQRLREPAHASAAGAAPR